MESVTSTRNKSLNQPIHNPQILILRALEACNAGCFMCDFAFSKDEYRFSTEDARSLVKRIANTNIKVIRLTGGETLLLDDLSNILKTFHKANYMTSIITNGYWLPDKYQLLVESKLDHIIVSIDGHSPETHDRFRKLPGLFDHLQNGIQRLRNASNDIVIRVNTVVGRHNINYLTNIYDSLIDLGINQWSIIPLKSNNSSWKNFDFSDYHQKYFEFTEYLKNNPSQIELLGFSGEWAGRNSEEIYRNWDQTKIMTPRDKCLLVKSVLYYTPKEGFLYPCNCVPHRSHGVDLAGRWDDDFVDNLKESVEWLYENGPSYCNGCEPINAALGEGLIDLEKHVLGF